MFAVALPYLVNGYLIYVIDIAIIFMFLALGLCLSLGIAGQINLGRRPMPDPLVDLPVPDPSTMAQQSNKKIQYTSGSVSLQPGVYKGGISVSGTGSLNLAPGIYYMQGGGFSFSGQGSLVGNGVMIYNAPSNGNADGISVNGQGSVQLTGMTSGIYQGMTFFKPPNWAMARVWRRS